MSAWTKGQLSQSFLREHGVVLSDDPQPLIRQGENYISDDATHVELPSDLAMEDPDSPGLWTSIAHCDPADLTVLEGIRKIGLKPVSGRERAQPNSELTGPLHIGSDVKKFEVQFGHRIINRSEPPSAFTS